MLPTSKLQSSDLLKEEEGHVERVDRPVSACLPPRSCRLNTVTNTHKTERWLAVKITIILS